MLFPTGWYFAIRVGYFYIVQSAVITSIHYTLYLLLNYSHNSCSRDFTPMPNKREIQTNKTLVPYCLLQKALK